MNFNNKKRCLKRTNHENLDLLRFFPKFDLSEKKTFLKIFHIFLLRPVYDNETITATLGSNKLGSNANGLVLHTSDLQNWNLTLICSLASYLVHSYPLRWAYNLVALTRLCKKIIKTNKMSLKHK